MKFAFIRDHQDEFDVCVMCAVFGVTRPGFYAWLKRPPSERAASSKVLSEQIRSVHHQTGGVYGSLKITAELVAREQPANRKTVARLMREMGLKSKVCKKFRVVTTDSDHDGPIAPNTLDQDFAVDSLNAVWAADITYIPTDEGYLYLAGVMDLCSRRIVGWSLKETLATELVEAAMHMALDARTPGEGLLHHSDRGCQYASSAYRGRLKDAGIQMSMSRRGNCYDNAVIESFWGKLKTEMLHHRRFKTKEDARTAVFEYIEMFYNPVRRHAAIGYVSPVEFEKNLLAKKQAA